MNTDLFKALLTCFSIVLLGGCSQVVSDTTLDNDYFDLEETDNNKQYTEPLFQHFPIAPDTLHTQSVAPVDINSDPDGPLFKTRLTEGAKQGPNFAGQFTIVSWGCGTACQTNAVISAKSGIILEWFYSCAGYSAKLDSRLLVINPQEHASDFPGDCYPEFYEIESNVLEQVPYEVIDDMLDPES